MITIIQPFHTEPKIDGDRVGLLTNLSCGESLHLECSLEDGSDLEGVTFLWLYNDVYQTSQVLDVPYPVSSGAYQCIATNKHGRDTHVVNVLSPAAPIPPRIGLGPMTKVHVGEKIEVPCHPATPHAHPQPQLHWRRAGSNLPLPSDPTEPIYVSDTHSLVINSVQEEDRGEYSCVASYPCGDIARNISVIVRKEPISHLCVQIPIADCQANADTVSSLL